MVHLAALPAEPAVLGLGGREGGGGRGEGGGGGGRGEGGGEGGREGGREGGAPTQLGGHCQHGTDLVDDLIEAAIFASQEQPALRGPRDSQHADVVRGEVEERLWLQVHLTVGVCGRGWEGGTGSG